MIKFEIRPERQIVEGNKVITVHPVSGYANTIEEGIAEILRKVYPIGTQLTQGYDKVLAQVGPCKGQDGWNEIHLIQVAKERMNR